MTAWKRICCPVDFSRESRFAMEEAADLAWRFGGDLTLVHVDDRPPAPGESGALVAPGALARTHELERKLGEWTAAAEGYAAGPVRGVLVAGVPAEEIVRFAGEGRYDVVVMGTRGRGAREHLIFGSVAEAVVREAPCTVVVVNGRVVRPAGRPVSGEDTGRIPSTSGPPRAPGPDDPPAGPGRPEVIEKRGPWPVVPNLLDYGHARAEFSWSGAREALDGLPGGRGLNIAHEAVDRHAGGPRRDRVALRFLAPDDRRRELTYRELAEASARFANVLRGLGVGKGDRVFALLGRIPELYVAALGTLKNGSVFCPLFSAFGPEPIRARLELGRGRVLVTTEPLFRRKVAALRGGLPALEHVLLAGDEAPADLPGTAALAPLVARAAPSFEIPPTAPGDPALLHFTSGTTGLPKGALHVHEAVIAHHATGRLALDLHDEDVFWCTADPGWVTGTSYGIVSPLTCGVTSVVDEAEFDAERWYRILQEERVSVWYTAPTAIRMLMKAGADLARRHDLSRLRFVASVGEPLNPEAVVWGLGALGRPIHDNWWQTETGGILIANFAAAPVKPGSMGRPLPGIAAGIVRREDGHVLEVVEPGVEGELAVRPGWPSMFRAYVGDEARYGACFQDGWYLTGDLARRDADGYFWFIGRKDDVIKSAGHLIGPFEVESALLEHRAVAEAAAIGKPDPVALESVKAFVALKPGFAPTEALRLELVGFGRSRLGRAVAPKEIEFLPALPRTRSGKIMRRLLKARELGLPEGDVSTLEGGT
jgi:acetyl-CoA synthetase